MKWIKHVFLALSIAAALALAIHAPASAVEVGEKAPDFELDSTKGGKLKLSSLRGKNVLINFYILDFDPTWIKHLQSSGSDDNYAKFQAENTEVLGISVNTTFSQKAFADFTKIKFPLLAAGRDLEATRTVLRSFGVLDEKRGLARRSYVIIDKEGVMRFKSTRPTNREPDLLPTEALLEEVKKINRGS